MCVGGVFRGKNSRGILSQKLNRRPGAHLKCQHIPAPAFHPSCYVESVHPTTAHGICWSVYNLTITKWALTCRAKKARAGMNAAAGAAQSFKDCCSVACHGAPSGGEAAKASPVAFRGRGRRQLRGGGLTGLLGYTWARWPLSLPTVQSRQQLTAWSVYFWLGALMMSVTGGSIGAGCGSDSGKKRRAKRLSGGRQKTSGVAGRTGPGRPSPSAGSCGGGSFRLGPRLSRGRRRPARQRHTPGPRNKAPRGLAAAAPGTNGHPPAAPALKRV